MTGPLQDRTRNREAIPLRAHNLLCLQGFQGSGYDEAFTANMARIHAVLRHAPRARVRIVRGPDHICAACPHLAGDLGCALGGEPHEAHMRAQDAVVAARLDLEPGQVIDWREILARIGACIAPSDLPGICTSCPWLPSGTCAAGIASLRESRGGGASAGNPRRES